MRAEIVTDFDALARLEADWWALFARIPSATPFSSPAWLLPWWRTFAPGALWTVTVQEDGRLVGLACCYIEAGAYGRRLLPLGIGLSDYLDILVDPDGAIEVGSVLGAAIGAGRSLFDLWSAEDAPSNASVLSLADPKGWRSQVTAQSACPVLALPASPEALDTVIPPRKHRKWRMAQNRVARRSWSLVSTTAETLLSDLAQLFHLHAERWQSKGEAGVLAHADVRHFHEAAAPALFAAGLLRLMTLRIDEAVTGVYYGLQLQDRAYAYLGGFDPAFGFESPGTLLVGAALKDAVAAGVREFHFLRGQEPYKYEWGAADRWTSRRLFEPEP